MAESFPNLEKALDIKVREVERMLNYLNAKRPSPKHIILIIIIIFFGLFAFSRATPAAYGGSQARGQIGTAADSLHHSHSNAESEPHLQPTPQLSHWARPGVESVSSWVLVGFAAAEPAQELQDTLY